MEICCNICDKFFNRKPSEVNINNFCSKKCYYIYLDRISNSDKVKIGEFVHSKWTALNLRAGKYRIDSKKNNSYKNINIIFTREEFRDWCIANESIILSMTRPSIDRLDKSKDYTLSNIQVLELRDNIAKDKTVFTDTIGICFKCGKEKPIEDFVRDSRRRNGRTSICKPCENEKGKIKYRDSK